MKHKKHKTIAIEFGDLYGRLCRDGDSTYDVIDGLDSHEDAAKFAGTWWVVTWPEHVLSPRYNGDATYGQCRSREEAVQCADALYGE